MSLTSLGDAIVKIRLSQDRHISTMCWRTNGAKSYSSKCLITKLDTRQTSLFDSGAVGSICDFEALCRYNFLHPSIWLRASSLSHDETLPQHSANRQCHVEILRYTFGVSLATKIQKKRWLLYINTCFNYNLQHSNAIYIVHSVYVLHVWSTDYETGTYTTNFRSEMVYWEPFGSKDVVLLV